MLRDRVVQVIFLLLVTGQQIAAKLDHAPLLDQAPLLDKTLQLDQTPLLEQRTTAKLDQASLLGQGPLLVFLKSYSRHHHLSRVVFVPPDDGNRIHPDQWEIVMLV